MRDGKALQMGTSHELGPELRPGLRHPVPRRGRRPSSSCWTTSWGVSHPHDRRADHGPRRRRRPARCRRGSPRRRCVVLVVKDEDGAGDGGRGAGRRAARPPGVRVELDDRTDVELRSAGHRLGAEGRAGAHRGRAARPGRRASSRWSRRDTGDEAAGARRRRGRPASRRCSTPSRPTCWPRPRPRPRRARPSTSPPSTRPSRRPATGFARVPWARRCGRRRRGPAARARRHRALPAPARRRAAGAARTSPTSSPSSPGRTDAAVEAARQATIGGTAADQALGIWPAARAGMLDVRISSVVGREAWAVPTPFVFDQKRRCTVSVVRRTRPRTRRAHARRPRPRALRPRARRRRPARHRRPARRRRPRRASPTPPGSISRELDARRPDPRPLPRSRSRAPGSSGRCARPTHFARAVGHRSSRSARTPHVEGDRRAEGVLQRRRRRRHHA